MPGESVPRSLRLERFCYSPMGTFGRLYFDVIDQMGIGHTQMLYTVERPWIWEPSYPAGVPFKSCVPDGEYTLKRGSTPKHEQALILDSPENWVFEFKQDEYSRYGILIHVGNTMFDVVGCIAPGKALGVVSADGDLTWAVLRSRDAFNQLWAIDGVEWPLKIVQAPGADSGGPP